MLTLRVPGHVRHSSQAHGGVLILDTAAGLWLALNATAGELWRLWAAGAEFGQAVAAIQELYPDVPGELIRTDAEQLLAELAERGLIQVSPLKERGREAVMAVGPRRVGDPGAGTTRTILAMAALTAASIMLRLPFPISCAVIRATRRGWCRGATTVQQAARTVSAVSQAARCFPGRSACLEQSLAAVLLAAATRRRLDWVLGAAEVPPHFFHAWVEAAGHPVNGDGIVPGAAIQKVLSL